MSIAGLFIRTVIAPIWAAKENSPYLQHLKSIEIMHSRSEKQLQRDNLTRLQRIVRHAYTRTDYYREQFDNYGITPDEITNLSDLMRLPLLTKEDIRKNKDRMVNRFYPREKLIPKKTSGSTGVSVELYIDEDCCQWKRAVTVAFDRWAGWDIGEPVGAIWGNPECNQNWRLYLRNLLLTRHVYLDTLKMDESSMRTYHARLIKKKPTILFGHAHSLFLFARFIEERNLTGIWPKGIISTCMVLHDFERQTIERVFGCQVTNRYGCEEVSLIACECRCDNMHLNCDSLLVEFLKDGKNVAPGEPGAIVVTDLTNFGMPIIRYKVGDVGVPSAKTNCPCGCSYPLIESLEGRVADYVVTPEGNFISGISLTENFAMHLPGVKQLQIVQEQLDELLFRIVKGEEFSEQTMLDLDRLTRERFGDRMHYRTEYVPTIQSESSGKYRFCISHLPNPFS